MHPKRRPCQSLWDSGKKPASPIWQNALGRSEAIPATRHSPGAWGYVIETLGKESYHKTTGFLRLISR